MMMSGRQLIVPPGFRFHPTDEELLYYYLRKKLAYEAIDLDVIRDVDLNKLEPWDLEDKCKIGSGSQNENEWYFFSRKDKKYPTGTRTNRATAAGFWKATGRDKVIHISNSTTIGMRKTLVFYIGRAPNGQKTDWIMHEYRLANESSQEDGWVVCRVFRKRSYQRGILPDAVADENQFKSTATDSYSLEQKQSFHIPTNFSLNGSVHLPRLLDSEPCSVTSIPPFQPAMGKLSLSFLLLLLLMALVLQSGTCNAAAPRKAVGIYELKKGNFSVKVTNWGAIITSVILPDSKGNFADVVLGYDRLGPYINNSVYFGALVGRVANRIAGGRFVLNGTVHRLYRNDGNNTLHGGNRGFSRVIWTVKKIVGGEFPSITLYYRSFDGEQGFPGDLDVYVTYSISGDYQLSVAMRGKALKEATPVNLAQHTYWNLRGHDGGSILSHSVRIFASRITPVDADLIPTGGLAPVQGTPYDFLQPETVGSRIDCVPGGYDINYVLDSREGKRGLSRVATVRAEETGRRMEVWADQPGVQFYTGNFLSGVRGKGGAVYEQHAGLCLETQGFPDAVNHPNFPSQIVAAGEEYRHNMLYKFSF